MADGERLPGVLLATNRPLPFDPRDRDEAWLLRDLSLAALVGIAEANHPMLAVDLDSVEGLDADSTAVQFLVARLGIDAVVSRRPAVAVEAARLGCIGLVRVFAFDSTGLRRSLDAIPPDAGAGMVISPALVLPYLTAADLAGLPRPLVAYGLIDTADQAISLLEQANAIVVRPETAVVLANAQRERRRAGPRASLQ